MAKLSKLKTVSLMDLVILLGNVYRGLVEPLVGFEDADRTVAELTLELNRKTQVGRTALESALWSCNLLNEQGKFWHPKGVDFETFLKKICQGEGFNKSYNYFSETEHA